MSEIIKIIREIFAIGGVDEKKVDEFLLELLAGDGNGRTE